MLYEDKILFEIFTKFSDNIFENMNLESNGNKHKPIYDYLATFYYLSEL